jgi:gluconate 2-dehydrogenase gamma chain
MADEPRVISRRDLLRGAAAIGAAAATPGLAPPGAAWSPASTVEAAQGAARAARPVIVFENLTVAEAELLEAVLGRLIPTDANGPGAIDACAIRYIDRALGGALSDSRDGYRAGLAALDRYARSTRGKPFQQLSPTDQDSVLIDVETGTATGSGAGFVGSSAAFFQMVKSHTWQGTFGDPHYGGNENFVGWDLIGFPGIRTTVSATDQQRLEKGELKPTRRSVYDTSGTRSTAQVDAHDDREVRHAH